MKALLLVDLENDFFPGGALGVKGGDEILPVVNHLLTLPFDCIVGSKDYHPAGHVSFAATHHKKPGERVQVKGREQILWPVHCVQGTPGVEFHPGWDSTKIEKVFFKGTDEGIDSYSAFFDNNREKSTGLDEYLKKKKVDTLYIAGLTTEYCVKYSSLDAMGLGFKVYVVVDGCKGVNLKKDDAENALREIESKGAVLVHGKEVRL